MAYEAYHPSDDTLFLPEHFTPPTVRKKVADSFHLLKDVFTPSPLQQYRFLCQEVEITDTEEVSPALAEAEGLDYYALEFECEVEAPHHFDGPIPFLEERVARSVPAWKKIGRMLLGGSTQSTHLPEGGSYFGWVAGMTAGVLPYSIEQHQQESYE